MIQSALQYHSLHQWSQGLAIRLIRRIVYCTTSQSLCRDDQTVQPFSFCGRRQNDCVRCSNVGRNAGHHPLSFGYPTMPCLNPSIDLPRPVSSSRRRAAGEMTECLYGACSRPCLLPTMASGSIGIDKEVIGQHTAVNAIHVRLRSRSQVGP